MFNRTRISLGLLYARVHFRRNRDNPFHFTESVSRSRRTLVVLPTAPRDIAAVQWAVRYLAERFSSGSMVVVARNDLLSWLKTDKRYEVLTYRDEDIGMLYIPRRELLRKLKKSTFDVALDLNLGFDLPGAFLCRESLAPLRVSFAKDHGDDFYNLQVRTRAISSVTNAYRSFLKCLDMF
ncbi:MAG: hypothetical protein WD295_02950 [Bacteroidota bacterium]